MTGQEAIAYIHSYQRKAHAPGLDRMRILLDRLGNPQKQLRFVHAAGTNGKGSTCACMAAVLQAAGYRVGLNTSPYLITFHERIRVNGEMISDEALADLTEEIRPIAESMAEHPTEFELITAIAFLHFLRSHCDLVVLEVGLGGALDASNVIDVPEVAVITALGMDHMAQLGPTLRDIAAAKGRDHQAWRLCGQLRRLPGGRRSHPKCLPGAACGPDGGGLFPPLPFSKRICRGTDSIFSPTGTWSCPLPGRISPAMRLWRSRHWSVWPERGGPCRRRPCAGDWPQSNGPAGLKCCAGIRCSYWMGLTMPAGCGRPLKASGSCFLGSG